MTTTPQTILVDVRTPAEYATGFLSANRTDAINIEYQLIAQLPQILSDRGVTLHKDDAVTLYCRSGRRSGIALQTLRELGYGNVRDIGGFEEARGVLEGEGAVGGVQVVEVERRDGGKGKGKVEGEARRKAFGELLAGLKGLE